MWLVRRTLGVRVAAATAFLALLLPHEPKAEGGGCCHTHSKGPNPSRQLNIQYWGQTRVTGFHAALNK